MGVCRRSDLTLYVRLLRQARPYWVHIGGLLLLGLLSTPLGLLAPLPLKIVVDSVVGSHPLPDLLSRVLPRSPTSHSIPVLVLAASLYITITLLTRLQDFATVLLWTYTGEKLVLAFRAQLFHHVQRLSLAYHDSKSTADSV